MTRAAAFPSRSPGSRPDESEPQQGGDNMAATLIRNGRIVTAVDDYTADVLVKDGRVETIGRNIQVGGDVEVHDATGLLVLPSGIDVHTHLDWEFGPTHTVDTFGTGT